MPISFHESRLKTSDGITLFLRCAVPDARTRANVLLVHGMGEHSARYFHVAGHLAEHGYRLCTFDLRGHGRSEGPRGDITRYEVLLDDLALVWEHFNSCDERPTFLYGHSLGGQIAINFAVEKRPDARGVILASPWLALAFTPAWWKLLIAQATLKIWPAFTQQTDVNPSRLSRDMAFLESMDDLDLVHHRMSTRMFFELSRGAALARDRAGDWSLPLLLIHGAADPITSVSASRDFFEKITCPDKALRIYPDTLHETHNDLSRQEVLADIAQWLDTHCEQDL